MRICRGVSAVIVVILHICCSLPGIAAAQQVEVTLDTNSDQHADMRPGSRMCLQVRGCRHLVRYGELQATASVRVK